jgi:hypothetical protein
MATKLKRAERRNRLRKHGMNDGDARTEPGAERSRFAGGIAASVVTRPDSSPDTYGGNA